MADFVIRHELYIVNGKIQFNSTDSIRGTYDPSWLDNYKVFIHHPEEIYDSPVVKVILYQMHTLKCDIKPTMLRLAKEAVLNTMIHFSKLRQAIDLESESEP